MNRRDLLKYAASLPAFARLQGSWAAALAADSDAQRIANDARPWAYGFWLDGNITKEGITADLEAMKSAGLGGLLFMDGSLGLPRGPHRFMSDSWLEQFRHLLAEAARLEAQVAIGGIHEGAVCRSASRSAPRTLPDGRVASRWRS